MACCITGGGGLPSASSSRKSSSSSSSSSFSYMSRPIFRKSIETCREEEGEFAAVQPSQVWHQQGIAASTSRVRGWPCNTAQSLAQRARARGRTKERCTAHAPFAIAQCDSSPVHQPGHLPSPLPCTRRSGDGGLIWGGGGDGCLFANVQNPFNPKTWIGHWPMSHLLFDLNYISMASQGLGTRG